MGQEPGRYNVSYLIDYKIFHIRLVNLLEDMDFIFKKKIHNFHKI
jgi:hypothetical protein